MNEEKQPYYEEETWTKGLSREYTLEKQIQLITYNYSKGLWDEFEYGIKALIPLLPGKVREAFKPLKHDVTTKGIDDHYQQFTEIQSFLEDKTGMMWKKKFVKTYE